MFISLADRRCIPRAKKLRRDQFDLSGAVHEAEYSLLPRPVDPATQKPLEPDHRFVLTLESDELTEEKSVFSSQTSAGTC